MMGRGHRGAHATQERSGVGRRVLVASGILGLVVAISAVGTYLSRDAGSAGPGIGGPVRPTDANEALPSAATPARVGGDPGMMAPDFAIPLADGTQFRLSSHQGRTVVVDFLAPGCPSCTVELATLTKTREAFRDEGVVVLVVDVGGIRAKQAAAYYRSLGGGDLAYGEDEGFRVAQAYEVIELGTTLVIGPSGAVAYRDQGYTSNETLATAVRSTLT